jgi:hypothetical protein
MVRGTVLLLGLLAATFAGGLTAVAPHEFSHATPGAAFRGPLPFYYDLYTFRGHARTTTIVAAFAVPAGRLAKEGVDGGVQYRFDVTLVLADTALRAVSRTDDSVFVGPTRPLADKHMLYTHIEVQAPPSASTLQRVIMSDATVPGVGQLYGSAFPIPDYSGNELMLSDIAFGQPGATAGWTRGDITLALLPTSRFPSSAFDVYYEIYNLPREHPYITEIAVQPVDETGTRLEDTRPVTIRFGGKSTAGPDDALPELRRVETSLSKGRHRITVTVTDVQTGVSARRARVFEVHGWERGATLVAARPHRHGSLGLQPSR